MESSLENGWRVGWRVGFFPYSPRILHELSRFSLNGERVRKVEYKLLIYIDLHLNSP